MKTPTAYALHPWVRQPDGAAHATTARGHVYRTEKRRALVWDGSAWTVITDNAKDEYAAASACGAHFLEVR